MYFYRNKTIAISITNVMLVVEMTLFISILTLICLTYNNILGTNNGRIFRLSKFEM